MATIRQKIAYKEVVKGSTIVSAMRKAGYAASTSSRTNKLTRTKGWEELVENFISDRKLAKVHSEGLEATKYESRLSGKGESELMEVPDYSVRHKYLESGYKVKGKYGNDGNPNKPLIVIISNESNRRYSTQSITVPDSDRPTQV